jgi:PAS domain S-box-containing protein
MDAPLTDTSAWNALPCGLAEVSDEGQLLRINSCLAQWLGVEPATVVGQAVGQILSRAAALMYHSYVYPVLRLGRDVEEAAITLQRPGGERMDALMCARRVTMGGRQVSVCTFQRIQERRRLEYQLLTAKRAADEAPGMLFQLSQPRDGPLAFTYASQSMLPLMGVPPHQAENSADAVWAMVDPSDRKDLLLSLSASGQSDAPWRAEFRVCIDGVSHWRELHATPMRDADGRTLWHGYVADISERKQLEASLRDKLAAERANQAKSAFLSRMSHELRTPLNGIMGFAQLMSLHQADNLRDDQRHKLDYIQMAGHSLLRLINEVLDISRIETGQLRIDLSDVALDAWVGRAMDLASPLAQARQVQLQRDGARGLMVHGDVQRLEQVLLNLLSNAIKYGPEGGKVDVHVGRDGPMVRVAVCDQGPGLNEAQRQHLFEPFNRLGAERSRTEGVGLGLVIARGLMQHMGGELSLAEGEGPGACFVLRLPLAKGTPGGEAGTISA